jgi:hypothetical protein
MARDEWIAERVQEFVALSGHWIDSWVGVEMALREAYPTDEPQFSDPAVPFRQLRQVSAFLRDSGPVAVGIYRRRV